MSENSGLLQVPEKFGAIFTPNSDTHRRKTFYIRYGGRASAKSHNFATAAILRALYAPERILCARETQKTLSDSVHRLLTDKIKALGVDKHFVVTDNEIRVPHNGSTFMFKGLGVNVDETVKSVEAITITYIEEGQSITDHSLDVLLPSVLRTENSEIWIAFNTGTVDDPVYRRFVANADPEYMDVELVNYYDNPFLPARTMQLIEADKKRDYDSFRNIWLGEPKTAKDGGVFTPEKIAIEPAAPSGLILVRAWDLASSAVVEKKNGTFTDPDYTVGALMGLDQATGLYYILDIVRLRGTPDVVEAAIVNTAALDGTGVEVSIAQDPGQAGLSQVQYYAKKLAGYKFHSSTETGSKLTRAEPFASQVNVSTVRMVAAPWNAPLINEMRSFNGEKNGAHDDQVDALSRAFSRLAQPRYMQKVRIF